MTEGLLRGRFSPLPIFIGALRPRCLDASFPLHERLYQGLSLLSCQP
jgi:hypothetical protein